MTIMVGDGHGASLDLDNFPVVRQLVNIPADGIFRDIDKAYEIAIGDPGMNVNLFDDQLFPGFLVNETGGTDPEIECP